MFYTDESEKWDVFDDFSNQTEEQRQFVYFMLMDQMVRSSGR